MDKKQTALGWLIEQLQKTRDYQRVINEANQSSTSVRDVIEQAKEMEKEQIVNAVDGFPLPNSPESCLAPTYSQAFRWFRDTHNCHHTIKLINEKYVGIAYSSVVNFSIDEFNTYKEAELECLKKLIELVKTHEGGNK